MDFKEPRPARSGDLDAVRAIVQQAYAPWVNIIGQEPGPMLDDYETRIKADSVTVVEAAGGDVKGILVLVPETDALLLDNVAVSPSAQGTGLGRQLLAYAEVRAREAGYRSIRLYTHEKMGRNIAYYSRIGYVETCRRVEKGLRRIYMTKTLS